MHSINGFARRSFSRYSRPLSPLLGSPEAACLDVDELLSPKFSPDDSFGIIHEKYNAMRHWCDVQKTGHDAYYQDIERYETREGRMPKVRRLAYLL
jgi:hypothetical protein